VGWLCAGTRPYTVPVPARAPVKWPDCPCGLSSSARRRKEARAGRVNERAAAGRAGFLWCDGCPGEVGGSRERKRLGWLVGGWRCRGGTGARPPPNPTTPTCSAADRLCAYPGWEPDPDIRSIRSSRVNGKHRVRVKLCT
jgi:hypothetical protein